MSFYLDRDQDTICALSTPHGKSGIALIRVSGLNALKFVKQLCSFIPDNPQSHKVYYGTIHIVNSDNKDASDAKILSSSSIDDVLVTYFAKGKAYCGDETLEISCHGNPWIYKDILSQLIFVGCRLAEKGEFTYRAFMNGRIDLVQAESVLTLIESQNSKAYQVALRQLHGDLSSSFKKIQNAIIKNLGFIEASIDFSTEDIEIISEEKLLENLKTIISDIQHMVNSYQKGRVIKDGFFIGLIGLPNVGKSSLFNAILKEEKAIVTDVPGTTRDVVEGSIFLSGLKVHFYDTAGLHDSLDVVEKIGIQKTRQIMDSVDELFLVIDGIQGWTPDDEKILKENQGRNIVLIVNKIDALDSKKQDLLLHSLKFSNVNVKEILFVSATTAKGLDVLMNRLNKVICDLNFDSINPVVINVRHFELLKKTKESLQKAIDVLQTKISNEFIAFDLQEALHFINEIFGENVDNQVLNNIFQEFCIGK